MKPAALIHLLALLSFATFGGSLEPTNATPRAASAATESGAGAMTRTSYEATLRPGARHTVSVSPSRSRVYKLPDRLEIQWRSHIPGGLSRSLRPTAEGHLLAASMSGYLFELDVRGRPLWSAPLRAQAAAPVTVLSNGLRVVLTHDGELWGFDSDGSLQFRRRLELETPEGDALVEPAADGSLLIAQGRDLLWVEADGALRAKTRVAARSVSLVVTPRGAALLQHTGTALWWTGDERPVAFTRLDSPVAAYAGPGHVLLASEHRISTWNWQGRQLSQWYQSSKLSFASAPIPVGDHHVAIRTNDNALVVTSAQSEAQRYVLGSQSAVPPPALNPVAGSDGTVAALSDDGRVVVVAPSRGVLVAQDSPLCAQPRSLASVAEARLVLACTAGTLFGLGS